MIQDEDDDRKTFKWETFKRSWDALAEDEHGQLKLTNIIKRRKHVSQNLHAVQRGIIRHLFLIIDMSTAIAALDFKPTRLFGS